MNKQNKTEGVKEKEAAGENKVQDIPSRLQEGPMLQGKNKKSRIKQSTTLALSRQKKSSGLVKSVKNHWYFEHEGKNMGDSRQTKEPDW